MNQINRLDFNEKVSSHVLCANEKKNNFNYEFDVTPISRLLNNFNKRINSFLYICFRLFNPFSRTKILTFLKSKQIELIHIHYLVDARFFLSLLKKIDKPKIVSCYGYDVSSFPKKYKGLAGKYLIPVFKHIDFFLAMSDDMKKDLINIGCPSNKIIVHYHGIHVSRFLKIKRNYEIKNKAVILIIASLVDKKGHKYLIDSIKDLDSQVELRIAGSGHLKQNLLDQIRVKKIRTTIKFLGHINNESDQILSEYANADIFIHPSVISNSGDKEGIPGAIVEAMASGLPVVSTYHAGIPNIIENNQNGILVPEKDSNAIKESIVRLIEDKNFRTGIGKSARKFADLNLNFKAKTEDLEKIYKNLTNNKNKRDNS